MLTKLKSHLRKNYPSIYKSLRILFNAKDISSIAFFLLKDLPRLSTRDKIRIVKQLYVISFSVESPHTQDEILNFMQTILTLPQARTGVVVEAGCFKGSSTAKFSIAADIVERTIVVFDSFEGIPDNNEQHDKSIFGGDVSFKKGAYRGALEEVKSNVTRFGKIDCCRFVKGWFQETMPGFKEPIAAIYLDVDLACSTKTCLKYLYPLLENGGVLYSQDGHIPLVLDVFNDDEFWLKEVGYKKPQIQGIWKKKLIKVVKEA